METELEMLNQFENVNSSFESILSVDHNETPQKAIYPCTCHAKENSLSNKSSKSQFIISLGFLLSYLSVPLTPSQRKKRVNSTKLKSSHITKILCFTVNK